MQQRRGVYETAAFFKDRQGIVHLKGAVTCPGTSHTRSSYRPADNKVHVELRIVQGAADGDGQVFVTGHEGAVVGTNVTGAFWLDGIHFRALN
jgi:hypothetical protein